MKILRATALVFLAAASLEGQERVRTTPQGDYVLVVYDDELQPHEMVVVPAHRVDVELSASVLPTGGDSWTYRYDLHTRSGSPLGVRFLQTPCPLEDAGSQAPAGEFAGRTLVVTLEAAPEGAYCMAWLGAAPVRPGEGPLTLSLESSALPGVAAARVIGATEGLRFPTRDPIPENDVIRAVLPRITGLTDGWKEVPTVAPVRPRSAFADPVAGAALVRQDLALACGELGWIAQSGVCQSLQIKLEQAIASLKAGQTQSAAGHLTSFVNELDAQRGVHVSESAYALLRPNADRLRQSME